VLYLFRNLTRHVDSGSDCFLKKDAIKNIYKILVKISSAPDFMQNSKEVGQEDFLKTLVNISV
jgi:hypothetical protein